MPEQIKVLLSEDEMPRQWYNMQADLPHPHAAARRPGRESRSGRTLLAPVFPMNLIEQEVQHRALDRHPGTGAREAVSLASVAPLPRPRSREGARDARAKIYYKNEGVSPAGSHKPNTAIAQAYYNKEFGIKRLTTETGAGQWGSALAFACQLIGLECKVYMVRISFDQKPFRKIMMQTWGAECVAEPERTNAGGPRRSWRRSRTRRAASASRSARRSRRP